MKIILILITTIGLALPSKQALHMFQQNRYEVKRYTIWLRSQIKNSEIIAISLLTIVVSFLLAVFVGNLVGAIIILLYSLYMLEREVKRAYIKPLVITGRVMRQIIVLVIIYIVLLLLVNVLDINFVMYTLIFSIFIPYLAIYLVALITSPIEYLFREMFKNKAKAILKANPSLIKVGITGSYGKTSSKNIVNEVLGEAYYSLASPASFNTPMGLTLTVRNDLKNTHEVFIAEMGADKVGDIVELVNLINPKYAIITSIGPQHLMTFKSIENIIKEKMALVEMLPADGIAILNKDNEYIKNYQVKNPVKVISYGLISPDVDYFADEISYSINGSSFLIKHDGKAYPFETRLLGEHNVSNILSAVALGHQLGIAWEKLIKAVAHVNFIEHRLELKKINGRTFIDNAFNSNPEGANMSLKVISEMDNQRIIITPGMIDLGVIQNDENYKFGYNMLDKVDIAILVGKNQTKPIYDGLVASGFKTENIHVFDTVREALAYAYSITDASDVILLENDLPDAFSN